MTVSNPDLLLAEEFVRHTRCNLFLTGKAGTGKTTFLHSLKHKTHKRLVVTAPTGVAAINAGGVTLHAFFQIPLGPFIPGGEAHASHHRVRREKKNIFRSLDLLVIDEISMVRADLLDGVDSILRRYRRCDAPFGGVQLLMIGDLHQLSPVVKKTEWRLLAPYYESPYFFSSAALGRAELIPIELKHIYRQTDHHFIDLLNRIRNNTLDPVAIDRLNARYKPDFKPSDGPGGYITLCTHNANADAINAARLNALPGAIRRFSAEVEGDFPEHLYPTAESLELKPGAQVMFIRNDPKTEKAYFNGKIGRIAGMGKETIEVRCPGDSGSILVEKATWENFDYTLDPATAELSQKIVGVFRQYPLKPAWAITIHKSQGLTFDHVIIDAQAAFAHGQVYVALSRCRTLEGIVLCSPLSPKAVKKDPAVQRFIQHAQDIKPTAKRLATARKHYQQHLMTACFDFEKLSGLLGRLTALLLNNARVIRVSGGVDIAIVRQRAEAEIRAVGDKFRRQLQDMSALTDQPADDPAIAERLSRASIYFQDKFESILSVLLETLTVETDNKEVRRQIQNTVKELKEETAAKLAGIVSCRDGFSPDRYLRALSTAVIKADKTQARPQSAEYTEADVSHPELLDLLKQWRKQKSTELNLAQYHILHLKTLVRIAVYLPDTLASLQTIKGIGRRLAERYGEELITMVADYRRKHQIDTVLPPTPSAHPPVKGPKPGPQEKESTTKITLDLFEQGLSITEIAALRGLTAATIEAHLAQCISSGDLEIGLLVPNDKRRAIEQTIVEKREASLTELKTALQDACSYADIKMVLAHLDYLDHNRGRNP